MGNVTLEKANNVLTGLHIIYSSIKVPLSCVSQTITFQMDKSLLPINLYNFVNNINNINVIFNPEIFPAVSIHYWKPTHVNLFTSGKVVVLGKDSVKLSYDIYEWLYFQVLINC